MKNKTRRIEMTEKKKKKITPREKKMKQLKYEVARELGLENDIKKRGWGGLTSREAGKIGGHMVKQLKSKKKET